ncbi:hypothetical protein [Tumidithrix helvetica]|uniref:hypothetical protein n=1 Tax=Tumidithrix helvetica TaxID=3457545 RepID=UPI003CC548EA
MSSINLIENEIVPFPLFQATIKFVSTSADLADLDLQSQLEIGKQLYYPARTSRFKNPFTSIRPVYHALLPHVTFSGQNLEPVWANDKGQAAIAWLKHKNEKILLIGLNVEEEIIRHRQGDPSKVLESGTKGGFGFAHERANYLFEDQIHPQYPTYPWADRLGFFLAETFSQLSGYPLVDILPNGAKGAVILTGDDDQAFLEKYDEQLRVIGDCPITYLLVPQTRHTPETLAKMPSNVEIGLHPDALEQPEQYDRLCTEQANFIRQLSGRSVRTLRNHGYLDRGYLGFLKTWEENKIGLSVNYSKADGTVMNGSLLPMKMRTPDRNWSNHYSLLTAFGDGIIFALNQTEKQAAKKIKQLVNQIESSVPGILVFNLHPQNIDSTRHLHKEVILLSQRLGWIAIGLDSYLDWLCMLDSIKIESTDKGFVLQSKQSIRDLSVRYFTKDGWQKEILAPWTNQIVLNIPKGKP